MRQPTLRLPSGANIFDDTSAAAVITSRVKCYLLTFDQPPNSSALKRICVDKNVIAAEGRRNVTIASGFVIEPDSSRMHDISFFVGLLACARTARRQAKGQVTGELLIVVPTYDDDEHLWTNIKVERFPTASRRSRCPHF